MSEKLKVGIIIAVLLLLVGAGAGTWYYMSQRGQTAESVNIKERRSERTRKEEKATESSSSALEAKEFKEPRELVTNDPQADVAKTLEKPDQEDTNVDGAKKAIETMVNWVSSHSNAEMAPNREAKTLGSDPRFIQNLKEFTNLDYKLDNSKTKVYKSNTDNIQQFTFVLNKGGDTVAFAGNYDLTMEQVILGTYRWSGQ